MLGAARIVGAKGVGAREVGAVAVIGVVKAVIVVGSKE
jgi:hypothetical protein